MPTKTEINNFHQLSEKEKIALAKQALEEYLAIMQELTLEQKKILSGAMKRADNKKIAALEADIKNT